MDHESSSSSGALGRLDVGLDFHKVIDYDRKAMRAALRAGAKPIIKEARRLVARRAVSGAGDFPGSETGRLKRAVGVVSTGSKGGWIKVGVRSIPGSIFYPAFLYYGSPKTGLARRGNFITAALSAKREEVRGPIRVALAQSLVPR